MRIKISEILEREPIDNKNITLLLLKISHYFVKIFCGSDFTNKYAEGYPNKRYYNGCKHIDELELHGIELVINCMDVILPTYNLTVVD